jgi:nucleotide-binding universal stress UspA family protein
MIGGSMLEKILVPLDGSKLSEASLGPGVELAQAFDSELHLLGVCEGQDERHCRLMQAYLGKNAEVMRGSSPGKPLKVRTVVLSGEPADRVVDYAARESMSLLITVTHGHTGIMPWTMGGTANKIVHGAPVPVLLLRAAEVKRKGPRKSIFARMLLPLDGSEAGATALPLVLEIAARLKGEVTLLSVVESGQQVHTIGGLDFIRFPEQQVQKMKQELSAYLEAAVQKFRDRGVEARGVLKSGHAAQEILQSAKAAAARLVAMSSHGKSGLREWVFGSVSNKVLHAGKTHLLLVKASSSDRPPAAG